MYSKRKENLLNERPPEWISYELHNNIKSKFKCSAIVNTRDLSGKVVAYLVGTHPKITSSSN